MRHDYGVALIGTSQIEDGGINFTCLGLIILLLFINSKPQFDMICYTFTLHTQSLSFALILWGTITSRGEDYGLQRHGMRCRMKISKDHGPGPRSGG